MCLIKDKRHILEQFACLELAQILLGGYGTCSLRCLFSDFFVMFSGGKNYTHVELNIVLRKYKPESLQIE